MCVPIGDDTSSVYVLMADRKVINQRIGKRDDDISTFLKEYFGDGEGDIGITDFYEYGLAIIFDDREESEKYEQDKQRKHKKFLYWCY